MAVFEIPLSPEPQTFAITLAGTSYRCRFTYDDADEGGWIMDIGTEAGGLLLTGKPLVTGVDLLAQHKHLGIAGGGALYVTTDHDPGSVPTFENLGVASHLFFVGTA